MQSTMYQTWDFQAFALPLFNAALVSVLHALAAAYASSPRLKSIRQGTITTPGPKTGPNSRAHRKTSFAPPSWMQQDDESDALPAMAAPTSVLLIFDRANWPSARSLANRTPPRCCDSKIKQTAVTGTDHETTSRRKHLAGPLAVPERGPGAMSG